MKKLKRRICASNNPLANENIITPMEVIELLSQLPELKGCKVSLQNSSTGSLLFAIGNNLYEVEDKSVAVM